MKKSHLLFALLVPFILGACDKDSETTEEGMTLDEWRVSDQAFDYNNDRKINEEDFEIYKAYYSWLLGDDAVDVDGNRTINYEDYVFYAQNGGEAVAWLTSSGKDLNKDGKINVEDFLMYQQIQDFVGVYQVRNGNFSEFEDSIIYGKKDGADVEFYFSDIINYLSSSSLRIDKNFNPFVIETTTVIIENELKSEINKIINTITINILSAKAMEMNFAIEHSGVVSNFALIFTKNDTAKCLSTSFNYYVDNSNIYGSFELVKVKNN